jgi:DNA-binding MarR family transcriptional regulator
MISGMDDATLRDDRPSRPATYDEGLFEHEPGGQYLHLMREVLLTFRLLVRRLSEELGVSGAQLALLRQMALAGGRSTTSALARELAVDPAAVTRLVAGLERLGFVGREQDERDGRRRPVVLTPSGRRLVVDFHASLHERESALVAELDAESVETTMRVLQTIRSMLESGASGRPA